MRARPAGRPLAVSPLEIRSDPAKGRGVFAMAPIAAGTLIEAAPVVVVPAAQCALIDKTILHDYYFRWVQRADDAAEATGAVALGLVSLCNHSRRPNARVRRNLAEATLDLLAQAAIAAGDEITIDYNCPLWFVATE
ncbi:MAG: SET domain-containing protein-lysine N-methyltransferase [Thiohalocapsa sp.]